ncbi:MAG: hypothetical protein V7629_08705 [Motiliproteus sp.]
MSQGLPRTALVVQVSAQLSTPLPQGNAALNGQASTAPTRGATAALLPSLPLAAASSTPTSTPVTASTPASSTAASSVPVTQPEVYKIQIRLEGRLFELLSNKPLDPGSSIQLSRGSDNRILLQQLPAPAIRQQLQQLQPAQLPTNPAVTAEAPSQARPLNTGPTIPPASLPSGPGSRPSLAQTNHPSPINTAIERVAIPPLKPETGIRIDPGERLNGTVLSSRASSSAANAPLSAPLPNPSLAAATVATQVSAQASSATNPANASHEIRINLQQGHKLEFISPRPLPQGTQMQLVRDSQGQLWAELPSAKTGAIEQALREHLPQQQPPAALLNLLSSAQTSGQLQQAKPLLFSLFQILLGGSLTRPLQTDAASVKQQVQNSGTLLESKLAQSNTQNINQDHKAILLKVIQQLGQNGSQSGNPRELPSALSERINVLTQQALSRVLVNQITSLGTQTQETGAEQSRTLALDVPILWQGKTENLHLKIQRDEYADSTETENMLYRWQVRLNFEVDDNRILEAELTLEAEQISIIWSGDAVLRQRLEKQLDQLQQRLESIGLKIKTLGIRERLPETGNRPTSPRRQLIDITT